MHRSQFQHLTSWACNTVLVELSVIRESDGCFEKRAACGVGPSHQDVAQRSLLGLVALNVTHKDVDIQRPVVGWRPEARAIDLKQDA